MKTKLCIAAVGAVLAISAASHGDYKLEDREPVHHTFSGDKTLESDLINGAATIIGDGGNTIRVEGERVTRADTQEQIARAKRDDVLDMNEKDGVAQIYENGPFRSNNGDHSSENHGFHENTSERHYNVEWNLTVHVPRAIALHLREVNGGLTVQDTVGTFDVKTVNGALTMTAIAGSGTASAVNGQTVVTFRENPKSDTSITSVNGKVDVTFQPNLAAEFTLHTVNGGMYTDFESVAMAGSSGQREQQNGKFVYKAHGESRIRVGSGGPQIKLETVNGAISIRKQK